MKELEQYSEPSRTSRWSFLQEKVNGWRLLVISTKCSILVVWQGSKHGSSSVTVTNVLNNIAFTFITVTFKKAIDELVYKSKPFNVSRTFLLFFPFPITSFSSLVGCRPHQNTTVSLECSLMNYSISGPSTFMCSNASLNVFT